MVLRTVVCDRRALQGRPRPTNFSGLSATSPMRGGLTTNDLRPTRPREGAYEPLAASHWGHRPQSSRKEGKGHEDPCLSYVT